jgi:hypothetical protein
VGKLPILSKPRPQDAGSSMHPRSAAMPLVYMGDYSVMGLVVSECARAIDLLKENAFSVTTRPSGSAVHFADTAALQAIVQILREHAIECDISDIVKHVYQG